MPFEQSDSLSLYEIDERYTMCLAIQYAPVNVNSHQSCRPRVSLDHFAHLLGGTDSSEQLSNAGAVLSTLSCEDPLKRGLRC